MTARRPYLAALTVTVRLDAALSLKDKRMVTRSLKDGLRSSFGVTTCEVDGIDEKRRAVIYVGGLTTSRARAGEMLSRMVNHVERRFGDHDIAFAAEIIEL